MHLQMRMPNFVHNCKSVCYGAEDLNPGSHACVVSILLTGLVLKSLVFVCFETGTQVAQAGPKVPL